MSRATTRASSGPAPRALRARKVCYILKRFPRLSETFILNEIRALERLGMELTIVSLLPREPGLQHAAVSEVCASVRYLPFTFWKLLPTAGLHLVLAVAEPRRYLSTLARAMWLGLRYAHPATTLKNFARAVIVAVQCRNEHVTHVHAHFANTPTRVAFFVSTLTGIPFSFTAHAKDLYLSTQDALIDRSTGAQFVVTCTRYNADHLKRLVPPAMWPKIHVVYHGTDLSAFAVHTRPVQPDRSTDAIDDRPVILSVGRLVPKKGMPTLVDACAWLRDKGFTFRCEIVGSGPLRGDIERRIEALSLSEVVRLRGAMTHEALMQHYARATLFALAPEIAADGDRDGIPNVLVEAMAAGLPVVSTFISGIPELIESGRTGLLVEPHRPDALAGALAQLLRNETLRRRLSTAARDRVTRQFECWQAAETIHGLLLGSETP